MNMSKLRKKHNRYRCLKTISYLLGFPLLIVMVLVGSMCLFEGDAFTDTKWYGVIIFAAIWVVMVILQIVISLITKSYNGRTLFLLIISMVILIGGSVFFDLYAEKKIDDLNEEYKQYGVSVPSYDYQAGWVNTWTSNKDGLANTFVDDVNQFCNIYNINYKSRNYGGKNGDGSDITYDKEADAYYSANGLYADGYIFGFKQAVDVLIDYNQSKYDIEHTWVEATDKAEGYYTSNGKNAVEELEKALLALDNDPEWIAYKNSSVYQAAYGNNGNAYKFMLNAERLDTLIRALSRGLSKTDIFDTIGTFIDIDKLLADNNINLTVSDLMSLTLDKAIDLINDLGIFEESVTEEMLMELLAGFSYYQDPSVKPKFSFIKDDTLRTFAYARYYAVEHGANVGSVLISEAEKDGAIGHVTMDATGYPADKFAYSLTELYELKLRNEVANPYYALMLARRYALIGAGIVAITTILFYHYKRKENEMFELISNAGRGGRR